MSDHGPWATCPNGCGHEWWTVGDDTYDCNRAAPPSDPAAPDRGDEGWQPDMSNLGPTFPPRDRRNRSQPDIASRELDVERLARALTVVTRGLLYPGDKAYDRWRLQTAEAIAREYAALAPKEADHD